MLVLESPYGDRRHEDRHIRSARLGAVIEHALRDGGTVLIPAFSIGRTQELRLIAGSGVEALLRTRTSPAGGGGGDSLMPASPRNRDRPRFLPLRHCGPEAAIQRRESSLAVATGLQLQQATACSGSLALAPGFPATAPSVLAA